MSASWTGLLAWTPYLLEGFAVNLLIATTSMGIGTLAGSALALLGFARWPLLVRATERLIRTLSHLPTLALMFYVATLAPAEWHWTALGLTLPIPLWFKAALALSLPATVFTAWNLRAAVLAWRQGERAAALLFLPNWLGTFVIGLLASTTASMIGVSELVAHCGVVINAAPGIGVAAVYAWGSAFFVVFCSVASALLGGLRRALSRRFNASRAGVPG